MVDIASCVDWVVTTMGVTNAIYPGAEASVDVAEVLFSIVEIAFSSSCRPYKNIFRLAHGHIEVVHYGQSCCLTCKVVSMTMVIDETSLGTELPHR